MIFAGVGPLEFCLFVVIPAESAGIQLQPRLQLVAVINVASTFAILHKIYYALTLPEH